MEIIKQCFISLIPLQGSAGAICSMNLSDTLRKAHCRIIMPNSKDSLYLISSKLRHIFQQVMGFFLLLLYSFPSCGTRHRWIRQWIRHCLSFVEMKGSQNKGSLLYYFHNGETECLHVLVEQWRLFMWCAAEALLFMLPCNEAAFTLQIGYGGFPVL